LVGTAAAFPLFFRDRTKPINQLPFSPSAKFPKSGSSCESRVSKALLEALTGEADVFHDGVITVASLEYWLAERVKKLTQGHQHATSAKPNTIRDFPIAALQ